MLERIETLLEGTVDPEVARAFDAAPNRVNELDFDPWGFSPRFSKLGYSFGKRFFMRASRCARRSGTCD